MATRSVLNRFAPMGTPEKPSWTQTHDLPKSLVKAPPGAQNTMAFQQQFRTAILAIREQHKVEIDTKSGDECINCHQRSTTASISPMSYMHLPQPFINVLIFLVCGKAACSRAAEVMMQELMAETRGPGSSDNVHGCAICGKVEDLKRCSKCNQAFYCGRAHQRQDLKAHKGECEMLARRYADLPAGLS